MNPAACGVARGLLPDPRLASRRDRARHWDGVAAEWLHGAFVRHALGSSLVLLLLGCAPESVACSSLGSVAPSRVLVAPSIPPSVPKFAVSCDLSTPGPVSVVVWNSSGKKLAAASLLASDDALGLSRPSFFGNLITIWNEQGNIFKKIERDKPFFAGTDTFAFVAGDRQIAAPPSLTSSGLAFSVFDVDSGAIVQEIPAVNPNKRRNVNGARLLVASPNQSLLAVAFGVAAPQAVALYSTRDWTKITDLPDRPITYAEQPEALAFSNDGKLLAIGTLRGEVLIYDVASKHLFQRIEAFAGGAVISAIDFTRDDAMIAIGAWQLPTKQKLPNGEDQFTQPSNLVRVFRTENAVRIATYNKPHYPAKSVKWTRDGRHIAFLTAGRTLHLWDPFRAETVERTIDLPSASSLAFAPDDDRLAVGTGNTVRLFELSNSD